MASDLNWFFVISVIFIGITLFIPMINSNLNSSLDVESEDFNIEPIQSGVLRLYENNFFSNPLLETLEFDTNPNVIDGGDIYYYPDTENIESVFIANVELFSVQNIDSSQNFKAELELDFGNGVIVTDEFDITLAGSFFGLASSEVVFNRLTGSISNYRVIEGEILNINWAEYYQPDDTFGTRLVRTLPDNFFGNYITGIIGLPAWFNTIYFGILSLMIGFIGLRLIRGS